MGSVRLRQSRRRERRERGRCSSACLNEARRYGDGRAEDSVLSLGETSQRFHRFMLVSHSPRALLNESTARCCLFRSVRINFQYAVDILCGSLNRACDAKKLFQYIGLKNTQSPIKIEFVFINGTFFDPELRRTFQPSAATMFACDQPVILPHVSRHKCTCMVSNGLFSFDTNVPTSELRLSLTYSSKGHACEFSFLSHEQSHVSA